MSSPRPPTTWPGPHSVALFEEEQTLMAPGIQRIALASRLAVSHGQGSYLTDLDGNRYLDFNVGVTVGSLGYAHPGYVQALREQLGRTSFGSFTTQARVAALRMIQRFTPPGLSRTQLFSSGAEAVEAALRLAKSVTGKKKIFGFSGAYHGKTAAALALSDVDWKDQTGPYPPGFHRAPYADCYRCPLKLQHPSCGLACAESLRDQIRTEAPDQTAAVLLEPIQGTAGNVVPPEGYVAAVAEITREAGALLIADEMITGFGRTGASLGIDHEGVIPDAITVGKSMGGGFPVSGVVTTDAFAKAEPWSLPSAASSSYGGNPLAAAAIQATLSAIDAEGLIENSRRMGERLLNGWRALKEKYRIVGDVRGRGLLVGVDLVADRRTRAPLEREWCEMFFTEGLKRGLIAMTYAARLRIHPALNLSAAQVDEALAVFDECLAAVESRRA